MVEFIVMKRRINQVYLEVEIMNEEKKILLQEE